MIGPLSDARFRKASLWPPLSGLVHTRPMTNIPDGQRTGRFFNVREASAYVRVSRSRFYELLKEGKIRARKLGARTLIERQELDRFLDGLPEATYR